MQNKISGYANAYMYIFIYVYKYGMCMSCFILILKKLSWVFW
jgi:hypothetical protein